MAKRASGRVRHLVRVALVVAVAERGPQCWPSQRKAAAELADLLDLGASTIRRALADETLAAEVDLAIDRQDPVSHPRSHQGATQEPPGSPIRNPQVGGPADGSPPAASPHVSTSGLGPPLLSGASMVPPAAPGRRPKEYRRSRFAGRCVLCLDELEVGRAFYLVPYDTGTATYCVDHAGLGLAMAQMFYDVVRGRPIPAELELYIREASDGT